METALFIALLTERLTKAFFNPLLEKAGIDKFYLMYVAWVLGGIFSWLAGLNLFSNIFAVALPGQILTAVIVGGGANLIHDIFSASEESENAEETNTNY